MVDLTGITAAATPMTQGDIIDAIQMAVLKKVMDIQAQGAMQLVQAASQSQVVITNNPLHIGNVVNTFA